MIILYLFLVLLFILLISRYGIVLRYGEGTGKKLSLLLRFGMFTFSIPSKKDKKRGKKGKESKPKSNTSDRDASSANKKKRKIVFPDWDQLPELAAVVLKALRRAFHSISIDELHFSLCVASRDPYETSVILNCANAAAEILLNGGLLKIKRQNVDIYPDFVEEKCVVDAELALSLRLYKLIAAAIFLFAGYLRWRSKQKNAGSAERT